jgi:hypothetical protein
MLAIVISYSRSAGGGLGDGAGPPSSSSWKHQRDPDPVIPLRLVEYTTRLWRHFMQNHRGKRLPAVVSVVVAQGPRRWTAPRSLAAMLDLEAEERRALAELLPELQLRLYAMRDTHDRDLLGASMTAHARVVLWFMKNDGNEQVIRKGLREWTNVLAAVEAERLRPALSYLFQTTEKLDPTVIVQSIEAAGDPKLRKIQEAIMTVAEMLRLEGRQLGRAEGLVEGRVEGRTEGHAESLLRILRVRGFTLEDPLQERVKACRDEDLLNAWFDRAVTASSLDDVFEDLT